MAESSCLHIQDRESGPIRIVEIPWISVRIGRAAFCEVRLTDPGLADEACRLHRRGRTWYLTPVAVGAAVVDGRPLDVARPLPFDEPFRVGPYVLALKRNKFAEPDWRPPRAGSSVEAKAAPRPNLRPGRSAPPPPRPRPEPPSAGPAAANPWEARWKAAGDRLRASRSVAERPTAAVPPAADSYAPSRPAPAAAPRYPAAPAPSSRFEPVGFAPRPVPAAAPVPAPRAVPEARAFVAPAPAPRRAAEPEVEATAPPAPSFFDSMSDPVAWAAEAPAEVETETEGAAESLAIQRAESAAEFETYEDEENDAAEAAPFAADEADEIGAEHEAEAGPKAVAVVLCDDAPSMYEVAPCEEDAPSLYEASSFPGESGPSEWTSAPASAPAPTAEHDRDEPDRVRSWARDEAKRQEEREREAAAAAPEPVRSQAEPAPEHGPSESRSKARSTLPVGPARRDEDDHDHRERFDPTRTPRSRDERVAAEPTLPSVQDVLNASQWARHEASASRPAASSTASRPRPKAVPVPTTAVAPAQWTLPAWLTWPPTTFLALAIGATFTLCSWWWAVDSRSAALVGQAAVAIRMGKAKDRPMPKGVAPPPTSWWRTTPLHLAQWGVYLSGTRTDHGWAESQADLISAAAAMAPLNPVVRLTKARMAEAAGQGVSPAEGLGLSRDAVALAWTGRRLHKAGKNAEALRAYRRALEIAERARPDRDEPPVFSSDPNAPRYILPGEALAGAIVGDLINDPSWSYRDWSAAVPRGGVAALAAAKGLRAEGRTEADLALDDLVEALKLDSTRAVDRAAAAEALTMRADWKEARRQYRAAIELMTDAKVKRSWWFNLADVAAHLNDESQRREALDAVLAAVDSDEISSRALDVQRASQTPGPKAN